MIRTFLLLCAWSLSVISQAQITLESCKQQARENYPLVRQYDLIQLSEQYTLSNVAKGNLPQISVSGKISYQSEATTFPFEIPGLGMKGLPKDQYQALIEIKQNIWDGGKIRNQKAQIKAEAEEHERQLDTSLYTLEERVNQVFFGILLLDEQLAQNVLLEEELARNQKTVEAYRINGTANDADVDAVKVEILQTKQQRIQLENNRMAYLRMLSLLTGKELPGEILSVLRYWVEEYHVDGFHLTGFPDLSLAAEDPFLKRTKLFAENWNDVMNRQKLRPL